MTFTITKSDNNVIIRTSNEAWKARFGVGKIPFQFLFQTMDEIAKTVNNEYHEECLFEVE